jgi:hypothetical protein
MCPDLLKWDQLTYLLYRKSLRALKNLRWKRFSHIE